MGFFPEVKLPGRGVDHPPPSNAEVKETVELCFISPSKPSWPVTLQTLLAFVSNIRKIFLKKLES
jgi:hypothetical protein